jgi:hypothetical protein
MQTMLPAAGLVQDARDATTAVANCLLLLLCCCAAVAIVDVENQTLHGKGCGLVARQLLMLLLLRLLLRLLTLRLRL